MIYYIIEKTFRNIFIVLFCILLYSIIFTTNIHYDRYTDARIISEKIEKTRNDNCDSPSHSHYYGIYNVVKWSGVDANGVRQEFTTKFKCGEDSNDGTSYNEIKNKHIGKIHKCCQSNCLWLITFAVMMIWLIIAGTAEYFSEDINDINKLKFYIFYHLAKFGDYHVEYLDSFIENKNYTRKQIISYSDIKNAFDNYIKQKLSIVNIQD